MPPLVVRNFSRGVARWCGVSYYPESMSKYIWAPSRSSVIMFTKDPTLREELEKADLVVLPNQLYCSLYPFNNCAYPYRGRLKRVRLVPYPSIMKPFVINVTYGGFHLTDEMIEYIKEKTGVEHGEWDEPRNNPHLIQYLLDKDNKDENLRVVQVDMTKKWEIAEYDGKERIRYF